ncbi:Uncharacterised protein [Vibrio cholerae]|nr:Uncharacterised protein [Vibrio cholerae]
MNYNCNPSIAKDSPFTNFRLTIDGTIMNQTNQTITDLR